MIVTTAFLFTVFLAEAAVPAATATAPAPKVERKICRSYEVTGSLVKRTRVCHTQKEWSELADASRRDMGALTEKNTPGQIAN